MKTKTKIAFHLGFLGLVLFAVNCKPVDDTPEITAPIVSTDTVYETTFNTAWLGGRIVNDGGSPVLSRGLCWSTKQDPTISDDTIMRGKGDGGFSFSASGLVKNTKYYVRAFASNGIGLSYGPQRDFTPGKAKDVDGNEYTYITIGTQTWMLENLKTTRYRTGDAIAYVGPDADWAKLSTAAFAYSNNLKTNTTPYGILYNYAAATSVKSICPKGWRLPTDADFATLGDELLGASTAGGKVKEAGLNHWDSPNMNATNESGFTAVGSGMRDLDGAFKEFKAAAYFWTSTPKDAVTGSASYVTKDLSSLLSKAIDKKAGLCIRCIKK